VLEITSFLTNLVDEKIIHQNHLEKLRESPQAQKKAFWDKFGTFGAEKVRKSSNYALSGRICFFHQFSVQKAQKRTILEKLTLLKTGSKKPRSIELRLSLERCESFPTIPKSLCAMGAE